MCVYSEDGLILLGVADISIEVLSKDDEQSSNEPLKTQVQSVVTISFLCEIIGKLSQKIMYPKWKVQYTIKLAINSGKADFTVKWIVDAD